MILHGKTGCVGERKIAVNPKLRPLSPVSLRGREMILHGKAGITGEWERLAMLLESLSLCTLTLTFSGRETTLYGKTEF
jgi:hypothetical protein